MSYYIPEQLLDEIDQLKESGKFDEAIRVVNTILSKDPSNEDALLQIADIQYRRGEINKADKAVDFLNAQKKNDPLGLYIKGILEMEKNNRKEAREFLKKALDLTNGDNHEILRCYGLCEYWYGNREKGLEYLKNAFSMNSRDTEVVYNLIQLYMLEHNYTKAQEMVEFFYQYHEELKVVDKPIERYDKKIALFEKFLKTQHLVNIHNK
ncbi:MAG: tetratricopeptide repeat protein [Candidatus Peribacteria bacterium]|jgi:tetratricopeptide (TPR) repeat protein|nr:tetratricopeptide repeat protein [Candidatus Peribacteria bacterium]